MPTKNSLCNSADDDNFNQGGYSADDEGKDKNLSFAFAKKYFRTSKAQITVDTPFQRPVEMQRVFEKAPYVTTKKVNYSGISVGRKYSNIIEVLKNEKNRPDKDIANVLLGDSPIPSDYTEKEYAASATIMGITHVSEEMRKKGATRIWRAYLRRVADRKAGFNLKSINKYFSFSQTGGANKGRKQVGDIVNTLAARAENDVKNISFKLKPNEELSGYFSSGGVADYISDASLEEDLRMESTKRHWYDENTKEYLKREFSRSQDAFKTKKEIKMSSLTHSTKRKKIV